MSEPPKSHGIYAMSANNLSTCFAELLPRDAGEVGQFIPAAAFAIDATEANLARFMGVSHATLSSWKARGRLSQEAQAWFSSSEFLSQIVMLQRRGLPREAWGLRPALEILRETSFRPFASGEPDQLPMCANFFGGIAALALFVAHCVARRGSEFDYGWVMDKTKALLMLVQVSQLADPRFPNLGAPGAKTAEI